MEKKKIFLITLSTITTIATTIVFLTNTNFIQTNAQIEEEITEDDYTAWQTINEIDSQPLQPETNIKSVYKTKTTDTTQNILINTYQYYVYEQPKDFEDLIIRAYSISQITPYNTLSNISGEVELYTNFKIQLLMGQDPQITNTITYNTYTSTHEFFYRYLDINTITSLQKEQELFDNTEIYGKLQRQTTYQPQITEIQAHRYEIDDIYYQTISIEQLQHHTTMFLITTKEYKMIYANAQNVEKLISNKPDMITTSIYLNGTIAYTPTYEVVDIGGLMFQILAMPFAFISQAFNLTIFEGTPYQLNISNILLGIIAIALLLWILKVILGKADFSGFLKDHKKDNKKDDKDKD